jgi:hypothetical protein
MNDCIKETILKLNPFAVDYQVTPPLDLYTEVELEKFAKLIVQECINHIETGLTGQKSIAHLFEDGSAVSIGMAMAVDILHDSFLED